MNIWFTNADTLTQTKIQELKSEIRSSDSVPDIIAVTEIKLKNYSRVITERDYNIAGYRFQQSNLLHKGSTRGVAIYVKESLKSDRLDTCKITSVNQHGPKEVISIVLQLANKESMLVSNVYRNPSSTDSDNNRINEFIRKFGKLKYEHQVIVGDFNRKDIDWNSVSATSYDDAKFIEVCQDSYLTQHVLQDTRGRGTNQPFLLDYSSQPKNNALKT